MLKALICLSRFTFKGNLDLTTKGEALLQHLYNVFSYEVINIEGVIKAKFMYRKVTVNTNIFQFI